MAFAAQIGSSSSGQTSLPNTEFLGNEIIAVATGISQLTIPVGATHCIGWVEQGLGVKTIFSLTAPTAITVGRILQGGSNFALDNLSEMQHFYFTSVGSGTTVIIEYFK